MFLRFVRVRACAVWERDASGSTDFFSAERVGHREE
jgi:hypothetical protein